eukprot:SAG11_NODE_16163_length_555_cov_1.335526_1_plen_47_part_10
MRPRIVKVKSVIEIVASICGLVRLDHQWAPFPLMIQPRQPYRDRYFG